VAAVKEAGAGIAKARRAVADPRIAGAKASVAHARVAKAGIAHAHTGVAEAHAGVAAVAGPVPLRRRAGRPRAHGQQRHDRERHQESPHSPLSPPPVLWLAAVARRHAARQARVAHAGISADSRTRVATDAPVRAVATVSAVAQ